MGTDEAGSAGNENARQCRWCPLESLVSAPAPCGSVPVLLEREEIPRRIDDAEPPAVRRRRLESDAWLVQKLVHQRLREVLDRFGLLGRERPRRRSAAASSALRTRSISSRNSRTTGTAARPATQSQNFLLSSAIIAWPRECLPRAARDSPTPRPADRRDRRERRCPGRRQRPRHRAAAQCRECRAGDRPAHSTAARTRSTVTTGTGDAVEQISTSTSRSDAQH